MKSVLLRVFVFTGILAFFALPSQADIVVQDLFDYPDGDVDSFNGGIGWAGFWANGNSNATRRFRVLGNEAIYNGSGNFAQTEQNRAFASAIAVGLNDTVTLTFDLIRPEQQAGRGIGIYLTNTGANQFFIGKEINDNVGMKSAMGASSTDFAEFSSSGSLETITTVMTYDGTNTSFVLSDSNETLATYNSSGQFVFDGISLAGYHGGTSTNGVDNISIDITSIPEPSSLLMFGLVGMVGAFTRRRRI